MNPNETDSEKNLSNPNAAARIYLQPIAAPSILGLYGLAGATFMVAVEMAGWFRHPHAAFFLFPFVAVFGGVTQLLAAMWAFKARDGLATAIHGTWGSFWIAYGILNLFLLTGRLTQPGALFPAMGYWFIVLAAITWMCMIAASAENGGLVAVLATLALGSTAAAISNLAGNETIQVVAGYLFIISSICAWYVASALMFEEAFGHEAMLRVFRVRRPALGSGINLASVEPGVIRGQ